MRPKKKINQTDIANALGVSNVSVSNALAGRKGVSDDLVRRVHQMAAEMGYEAGNSDEGGRSNVVAVVIPSEDFAGRADRLAEFLQERRFRVKRCVSSEISDGECAKAQDLRNCLGILLPAPLPAGELRILKKISCSPVVGIGFFDSHVPMDYVADDGFHGAQLMVQYLREKGYEKLLYVKPYADDSATGAQKLMWEDRLLGYRSELYLETLNRGLTMEQAQPFDLEEERGILTLQEAQAYIRNRQEAAREQNDSRSLGGAREQNDSRSRDDRRSLRTAFFCGDMKTAYALLDCLAESRIAVPDEIGIVGYMAGEEDCPPVPEERERARQGFEEQEQMRREETEEAQASGTQITAYENCEKKLFEQCCALLLDGSCGGERAEEIRLTLGGIREGFTA